MRSAFVMLFLCVVFCSGAVRAEEAASKPVPKLLGPKDRCEAPQITIKADDAVYPGEKIIANSSNLRRKAGLALIAAGDRIYFTGKIVDSDCVPVMDAKIEIWQADMVGAYSFPIGKRKVSTDQSFVGTGKAVTDDNGTFSFLTIFPGNYDNRAPHINYRITHPDFKPTIGAVFFEYHPMNEKDPVLQQYRAQGQVPLIAQKMTPGSEERLTDRDYDIKIVLKGRSAFHKF